MLVSACPVLGCCWHFPRPHAHLPNSSSEFQLLLLLQVSSTVSFCFDSWLVVCWGPCVLPRADPGHLFPVHSVPPYWYLASSHNGNIFITELSKHLRIRVLCPENGLLSIYRHTSKDPSFSFCTSSGPDRLTWTLNKTLSRGDLRIR